MCGVMFGDVASHGVIGVFVFLVDGRGKVGGGSG